MAKYSFELKKRVVEAYLRGLSCMGDKLLNQNKIKKILINSGNSGRVVVK
jgi:hypothetical protein